MTFYAVTYTYIDDADAIARVRPDHRSYLAQLVESGELYASGPCPGTAPARALLVFRSDSPDRVAELLRNDPFQVNGIVANHEILEWDPVLGALADQR